MRDFFPKAEDGFNFLLHESEVESLKPINHEISLSDSMNLDFDEFLCF